jgi:hypothetical protein
MDVNTEDEWCMSTHCVYSVDTSVSVACTGLLAPGSEASS